MYHARAETAQANFDLEQADGKKRIARVTLTETIGASFAGHIHSGQRNAAAA